MSARVPGEGKRRPRRAARGVPGVPPADVAILGGGVAGSHAALISSGMGATVDVIDRNPDVFAACRPNSARGWHRVSTSDAIETLCRRADLVIASVMIPAPQRRN